MYLDCVDWLFMDTYTVAMVGLTVMHWATLLNSLSERPSFDSMRAMATITLGFALVPVCQGATSAGHRVVGTLHMAFANVSVAMFIELAIEDIPLPAETWHTLWCSAPIVPVLLRSDWAFVSTWGFFEWRRFWVLCSCHLRRRYVVRGCSEWFRE